MPLSKVTKCLQKLGLSIYDGENPTGIPKNSIKDARTPQPRETVFNIMRYRSSETVQRLGYFQSSVSYIKVKIMFK